MKLFPGLDISFDTTMYGFSSIIVKKSVGLGAFLAMILVAMGGYKILTSSGDPAKIKDGKEQIQNAILGFVLIVLAVSIVEIIFTSFHIS